MKRLYKYRTDKFGDEKLKRILSGLFALYCVFYIILYFGYLIIIHLLHSSYSIVSVSAIILPFLVFLAFQLPLWIGTGDHLQSSRKRKNLLITIIGWILPLSCAVLLGINEYKSHFTTEKWLNNESSRVYMVDDLLERYDFNEMTKVEVTKLLGTPPETNYFKEFDNIVYYLGDERGLISIDSEWLIVEFYENQKVKAYGIVRD